MIQWTCHIKALSITERSLTMSEKRKDNKGRILRTGESQRKDLIYQYRYTDIRGKRQTIYSSDLKELREKEKTIQKQLDDGIDYAAGKITVLALLERYISLKQGVRYNTKVGYHFVLNLVKKEDFGYRQIRDIKVSDAQQWIMKLHNDGKGYSTITSVRERGGKYYVEKTKTECGCRYIPMTDEVFQSLNNILARRKKVKTEIVVDGYQELAVCNGTF